MRFHRQQELQIQDRMVDDLGNRIDMAQEHVGNVNTRMKVRFRVLLANLPVYDWRQNNRASFLPSHARISMSLHTP